MKRQLAQLSSQQKKSGLAAWLGWLFDGLDMHIYTLVAAPFVAQLLGLGEDTQNPMVKEKSAIIQAAFLVGWALGGAFFGKLGDMIGRSRVLTLTILTYAGFTGLSAISTEWWHLMICRFLSALGIGGEWAVGAALLAETWPKHWRPWIAACLQTAVNLGIMLAAVAGILMARLDPRWIFLVGVLPALLTFWIRKAVPETKEWTEARRREKPPKMRALFGPGVRAATWRATLICALGLTAHWAFMFWQQSFIRSHPEIRDLSAGEKNHEVAVALMVLMVGSIAGNFLAGWLAKMWGFRRAIILLLFLYGTTMILTFCREWNYATIRLFFVFLGAWAGVFGLFTMCLPPLFPTLLRTTGAGFSYNIGRLAAAVGVVFFHFVSPAQDVRLALLVSSAVFFLASASALLLPEANESSG